FPESIENSRSQLAVWEAVYGLRQEALDDAALVLKSNPPRNALTNVAMVYAVLGQDDRASKIMSDIAAQNPVNTYVQYVDVPSNKAILEITHHQPAKAIDLLDGAMVYARADSGVLYLRAWAYLEAKQGKEAKETFQRILGLRNLHQVDPTTFLSQLGMARAD